jgi:predicted acetyltransferase
MKIRRIGADERISTTFPLQAYAFDRTPLPPAEEAKFPEYVKYNAGNVTLAADDGGEILAAATAIPMRQNVRGVTYPMAGIASVASHPLARRQGHVRAVLTQLLGEMRESGHPVSALYPFRPSFYQKFGYVTVPKARRVTFSPAVLSTLLRADLAGEVSWERLKDGYQHYRDFTLRLLGERHGFSVFPDFRAARFRDENDHWLVTARVADRVVAVAPYRISSHGGEMAVGDLLTDGPLGRTLLLRFFAQHVDQVERVVATVAPDETPELWATDIEVVSEARVKCPGSNAPMVRVLDVEALSGIAAGPGRVTVTVVDDPFIAGEYTLDGNDGRLDVRRSGTPGPAATLTPAGLSALVYGVLDPAEVVIRGLGSIPDDAAGQLRAMFPRRLPYLYADF